MAPRHTSAGHAEKVLHREAFCIPCATRRSATVGEVLVAAALVVAAVTWDAPPSIIRAHVNSASMGLLYAASLASPSFLTLTQLHARWAAARTAHCTAPRPLGRVDSRLC